MKLGTRIFLCYAAIFSVCFAYPIKWTLDNLRTRYLEGVEDPLADQANILAEWTGSEMSSGKFSAEHLSDIFNRVKDRSLSAPIYDIVKKRVDMGIYITDRAGRIIYSSLDDVHIGDDYSQWRDVFLTLEGRYGARTTRRFSENPASTVLHVAAPITVNGEISGVLTVVKPTTTINRLIQSARPDVMGVFGISAVVAILLSFIVSRLMTRSIKRLTAYANDVRSGKRVPLPDLDRTEIGEMGNAFERMREALEGRKYVEEYVQALTHEIKSPVSAIRGAAELLDEEMKPEQKVRFLTNIRNEANRIQEIVDRMLELAALENLKILEKKSVIRPEIVIPDILESEHAVIIKKSLNVQTSVNPGLELDGDSFLVHQAMANIFQNAVDFSPSGGNIKISCTSENGMMLFTVQDQGPGVPDYALEKVFNRFFSLHRPDTGRKSTGLGLNFVREVASLHNGSIVLVNSPEGGACAVLKIPLKIQ